MLRIKNVTKNYTVAKELQVRALDNFSLNFRKNEFVAVLGPSGCGKTTLLNIIGGLDNFGDGDVLVGGRSIKNFRGRDMDEYRNRSVGFVFQGYNLVPNLNVLGNVTLALSLQGVPKKEREGKARAALKKVGLEGQMKKRPNQLSGGQMQRVAIARAIVNDPEIILADEPTGALDSETGEVIAELLKELSKDRLVITVTHNGDLARRYATRIVNLLDGRLVSDTDPYTDGEAERDEAVLSESAAASRTSSEEEAGAPSENKTKLKMPLKTALGISVNSMLSKKWRVFWTSFAGSIGIFGIAIVLAISIGMGNYVNAMQTEAVGDSAIRLGETAYSLNRILSIMEEEGGNNNTPYPDIDGVIPYQRESFSSKSTLTDEFIEYIRNVNGEWVKAINYTYSVQMHVLEKDGDSYTPRESWAGVARQMIEEDELIEDNYDVLYKSESSETGYPKEYSEVSLVVDKFNRISPSTLKALGISFTGKDGSYRKVPFTEIVDKEYTFVLNDGWYIPSGDGTFRTAAAADYANIAPANTFQVKIVSILRVKNNDSTLWLDSGIAYLPELSEYLVRNARESEVGRAQLASKDRNVLTGEEFKPSVPGSEEEERLQKDTLYVNALKAVGAFTVPTSVQIYPTDLAAKRSISAYIDAWNDVHPDGTVDYLDLTNLALTTLSNFIDVVTYILVAFSAVALIVSSVMISVTTYTSVVERTKEIGILRSLGARKLDISGIFNGESAIVGGLAGFMGVAFALIAGVVINALVRSLLGVSGLVAFNWQIVVGMFFLSVTLTLLAGLVPAVIAANKNPVSCLRSE